jgi:hypothetical protein
MVNTYGYLRPTPIGDASTLIDGNTTKRESKFWNFHLSNEGIYIHFCKFAREMEARGHTKLSSELLLNRVRWETLIQTSDPDYKISNDWRPYYSRMYLIESHKKHFFKTKAILGEWVDDNGHALLKDPPWLRDIGDKK